MKVGDTIESLNGIKIKIESIRETFITGREVDFKPSCSWEPEFRICSFENIKNYQTSIFLTPTYGETN
jgi:hypothetical protein